MIEGGAGGAALAVLAVVDELAVLAAVDDVPALEPANEALAAACWARVPHLPAASAEFVQWIAALLDDDPQPLMHARITIRPATTLADRAAIERSPRAAP